MTQSDGVLTVTPGTPRPVDGLCPRCVLPSLVAVSLFSMCEHGPAYVGEWTGCVTEDCGEGS
jgi:hypothetical protein